MANILKVLVFGDIVGEPGRKALADSLPKLREKYGPQLVIANGENVAGGLGIEGKTAHELKGLGIQVITLGDHTWQRKEFKSFLPDHSSWIVRPENYPDGAPGKGWTIWQSSEGVKVGVANVMGRVFLNIPLDCPFRAMEKLLSGPLAECDIIVVDVHAEATSEKVAMGRFLDGRVAAVFGTHTHVQTADECILPGGTAYITDLGMCGSKEGVIGMDADTAIRRFLLGVNESYKVGGGRAGLSGIYLELNPATKSAQKIERITT